MSFSRTHFSLISIIFTFQSSLPTLLAIITQDSERSLVEHKLGTTILPGLLLRGQVGDFVVRPLKPRAYRNLGLAYSSKDELSPASKIFLEYAKDFLLDDEI